MCRNNLLFTRAAVQPLMVLVFLMPLHGVCFDAPIRVLSLPFCWFHRSQRQHIAFQLRFGIQ